MEGPRTHSITPRSGLLRDQGSLKKAHLAKVEPQQTTPDDQVSGAARTTGGVRSYSDSTTTPGSIHAAAVTSLHLVQEDHRLKLPNRHVPDLRQSREGRGGRESQSAQSRWQIRPQSKREEHQSVPPLATQQERGTISLLAGEETSPLTSRSIAPNDSLPKSFVTPNLGVSEHEELPTARCRVSVVRTRINLYVSLVPCLSA